MAPARGLLETPPPHEGQKLGGEPRRGFRGNGQGAPLGPQGQVVSGGGGSQEQGGPQPWHSIPRSRGRQEQARLHRGQVGDPGGWGPRQGCCCLPRGAALLLLLFLFGPRGSPRSPAPQQGLLPGSHPAWGPSHSGGNCRMQRTGREGPGRRGRAERPRSRTPARDLGGAWGPGGRHSWV